ncbi:MAG: DUF3291 domain-containing protein [Actinomycetota bacterium]
MHLAQYNIGRLVAPREDPAVAEFMDELDRINALAEASPGYLWRAQSDEGNLTAYHLDDDPQLIPNLSVWRSVDALRAYVYRSEHRDFLRRRREWFETLGRHYLVLWWIPEDHEPTLDEGRERLDRLETNGPSPEAFTFRTVFDPEGVPT